MEPHGLHPFTQTAETVEVPPDRGVERPGLEVSRVHA